MKRITKIEFCNYKAFYDKGEQNKLEIPEGNNLLIYGENGSGKSSIYEGLKQFFNSSDATVEVIPSRHIKRPKLSIVNKGTPEEKQEITEVFVKATFQDSKDDSIEEKIFGIPTQNVKGTTYISNANKLNGFLSYRELLKTYLMDNLKDKAEFRTKFASLLIETILAKNINKETNRTYLKTWNELHIPKIKNKELILIPYSNGLRKDIHSINILLNEILKYFDSNFKVELALTRSEIKYHHSFKMNRLGKYPILDVDLKVKLYGKNIDNGEETHLTVLNEARLSSLALSIYLASIINTSQDNFDYKILFLDDIFIGLDMGNRIPLLKILSSFKKPIIEEFVDDSGDIIERIKTTNDEIEYEATPFFDSYQLFITTYDRHLFELARQLFDVNSNNQWHYIEMYVDDITYTGRFNVPCIIALKNKITKAEDFLHKHDYRACASYLRATCEEELDRILPKNKYRMGISTDDAGNPQTNEGILNDKIIGLENICADAGVDFTPFKYIKMYKNILLNTLSHNDVTSPYYKQELIDTLSSVKELKRLTLKQIPGKYKNFKIVNKNDKEETVYIRIKIKENIFFLGVDNSFSLVQGNKCLLEGVQVGTGKEEPKVEFNSFAELYEHVYTQYKIPDNLILHDNLIEREKTTGKTLMDLVLTEC